MFLGLFNPYARFVPNCAHIAALLDKELRKCEQTTVNNLMQEEEDALATLQDELV